MSARIVARNYADTLLALARREGGEARVDAFEAVASELADLFRDHSRVGRFLASPLVSAAAKKAALRKAFVDRADPTFVRFLMVVVDRRRAGLLGQIGEEYRTRVDEARGRVRATVTTARPLDGPTRERVVAALERRTEGAVVATFRVREEILGGMLVRMGDQILDGTLRRRLGRMRRRLLEARPHRAAA